MNNFMHDLSAVIAAHGYDRKLKMPSFIVAGLIYGVLTEIIAAIRDAKLAGFKGDES